jgi:uncharacterized protein YndB with AHSA1/START domain
MINFETGISIRRPIDEVFAYVSDPLNFPAWNSAVESVSPRSVGSDSVVGSAYSMERRLPSGRAENGLEITSHEPPSRFGIRTTSGPTPFSYDYRFSFEGGATLLQLAAEVALSVPALIAPLARRAVRRGVDENLATLKAILEGSTD